jgi:hypothetical protein
MAITRTTGASLSRRGRSRGPKGATQFVAPISLVTGVGERWSWAEFFDISPGVTAPGEKTELSFRPWHSHSTRPRERTLAHAGAAAPEAVGASPRAGRGTPRDLRESASTAGTERQPYDDNSRQRRDVRRLETLRAESPKQSRIPTERLSRFTRHLLPVAVVPPKQTARRDEQRSAAPGGRVLEPDAVEADGKRRSLRRVSDREDIPTPRRGCWGRPTRLGSAEGE